MLPCKNDSDRRVDVNVDAGSDVTKGAGEAVMYYVCMYVCVDRFLDMNFETS